MEEKVSLPEIRHLKLTAMKRWCLLTLWLIRKFLWHVTVLKIIHGKGDISHPSLFLLAMLMSSLMSSRFFMSTYGVCVATKCRRVKRFRSRFFVGIFYCHVKLYKKGLILRQTFKKIVDFCTMMAKSIEIVVARFARKFWKWDFRSIFLTTKFFIHEEEAFH